MADITMCKNDDCAHQDTCWRLLAPPDRVQTYCNFIFDDEEYEKGGIGCEFYIETDISV